MSLFEPVGEPVHIPAQAREVYDVTGAGDTVASTLAAALAEDQDALEEIYEPFLIQIGFLDRTPRGRVATRMAYDHFGIKFGRQPDLF